MNQTSLYYFVITAQELNMTKAAARLFISQQALSEHIRKLERQYDAVFFNRKGRLSLTYQGERMLAYATQVLDAEKKLTMALMDISGHSKERMSIGMTSNRGTVFMPDIFSEFRRKCPHVIVDIESGNYEYIERQYQLDKLQLFMGMTVSISSNMPTDTLYQDELYFIVSRELLIQQLGSKAPEFLEDHKDGVSVEAICSFPLALPPNTSSLRIQFEKIFMKSQLLPNMVMETTNHDIMFDLCKSGVCGCFVSQEMLYRKVKHKSYPENILIFPARDMKDLASFCLVYQKDSGLACVDEFVRCTKSVISSALQEIENVIKDVLKRQQISIEK